MNQGDDAADAIQERVRQALAKNAALKIFAGRTKSFLGRRHDGIPLDLSALTGVVSYEPNELVLVARPGTKLSDIEALCRSENQYFAFEPPAWGCGRDHRRHCGLQPLGTAALQDGRTARSLARCRVDRRPRRANSHRRQSCQKRHGLRSVQSVGWLLRNARGAYGSLPQGLAPPRNPSNPVRSRADARSGVGANSRLGGAASPDHGPSLRRRPVSRPRRRPAISSAGTANNPARRRISRVGGRGRGRIASLLAALARARMADSGRRSTALALFLARRPRWCN